MATSGSEKSLAPKNNKQRKAVAARPKRNPPARKRRARANNKPSPAREVASNYNLPANVFTTKVNRMAQKTHKIPFQEIVGRMEIFANNPPGNKPFAPTAIPMNPMLWKPDSRLRNLSKAFEKFRFNKLTMTIRSGAPTTSQGELIAAYAENPDYYINPRDPSSSLSALGGAASFNIWGQTQLDARIMDKKKWYNVDPDSEELMMVQQGTWYIFQTSPTNLSGSTYASVWLEGEIEFTGTAAQHDTTQNQDTGYLPYGRFVRYSDYPNRPDTVFSFEDDSQGVLDDRTYYMIFPQFQTAGGENVGYIWVDRHAGKYRYALAKSEDDALQGLFMSHLDVLGESLDFLEVTSMLLFKIGSGDLPSPGRQGKSQRENFREKVEQARANFQRMKIIRNNYPDADPQMLKSIFHN